MLYPGFIVACFVDLRSTDPIQWGLLSICLSVCLSLSQVITQKAKHPKYLLIFFIFAQWQRTVLRKLSFILKRVFVLEKGEKSYVMQFNATIFSTNLTNNANGARLSRVYPQIIPIVIISSSIFAIRKCFLSYTTV